MCENSSVRGRNSSVERRDEQGRPRKATTRLGEAGQHRLDRGYVALGQPLPRGVLVHDVEIVVTTSRPRRTTV